jgi:predicted metalloprotease with PDZ domain
VMVHSATRSGLMVENLTPQLGDFFGAKNGQGVLVRSVEKGSRAEKAGFRAGDVIVRVNGEPINDTGDFTHALRGRKDNTVNVNIIRDKKEQTLTLTLPERKESELFEESFDIPEIDAETRIDLSQVRSEAARIAAGEIRSHQGELKREILEMQRELRDQQLELQEELNRELQENCTEI